MKSSILKAAREQSGKTQAQAAKEVGIAKTAYQRYERGGVTPNVFTAIRIAKTFNTTVEKLWSSSAETL